MKTILFFLLLSTFYYSQKFSFIYETKYKLNTNQQEDVNSDNMILDFENNKSIFRESDDKNSDSLTFNNKNGMFKMGIENQFYVKKIFQITKFKKS